jgi:hypothetical protein
MGKASELYFEVSRDGKLIYHPKFFFEMSRAVHGYIDVEA